MVCKNCAIVTTIYRATATFPFNTFSARDVLKHPKICYRTGQGCVNRSYIYSIFSALQALQQHFCWSIQYTHALCRCLYTILGLALNVLKVFRLSFFMIQDGNAAKVFNVTIHSCTFPDNICANCHKYIGCKQ